MNRRTRYLINRLANGIENSSESLVRWLRAKAERKSRPKPLAFPSELELMMGRLHSQMMQNMTDQITANILMGPKLVRVTDDIPYAGFGVHDGKPDHLKYVPIVYNRSVIHTDII